MNQQVLITGSRGFIAKNLIQYLLKYTNYNIVCLDKPIDKLTPKSNKRLRFVYHDLRSEFNNDLVAKIGLVNYIIHLGGTSNVDVSITDPVDTILTNVIGTANVLNYVRSYCDHLKLFMFLSTAEVFGTHENKYFKDRDIYNPLNPYAGSKAGAECLCLSFAHMYNIPLIICKTSNIYGPHQLPSRYISVVIDKILKGEEVSIYCDVNDGEISGRQYLYSEDICNAFLFLMLSGKVGENYNIASKNPISNIDLALTVSKIMNKPVNYKKIYSNPSSRHKSKHLLCTDKIRALGWKENHSLEEGLTKTIGWHISNYQPTSVQYG